MGLRGGSGQDPERSQLRAEQSAWVALLGAGEQVQEAHRMLRSTILFTNRRLIFVEESLSGRQVDYVSIPYRAVTHFAVAASGRFSRDADLKIWVSGRTAPFERQFGQEADVYAVQALLAHHVAG